MDESKTTHRCSHACDFKKQDESCPYPECLNANYNKQITMGQWVDYDSVLKKKIIKNG